jgi:hypothetical protein
MVMLAAPGAVIRGRSDAPEGGGTPPPMPPGIVLSQSDMEELFMLVSRGTPVTVQ